MREVLTPKDEIRSAMCKLRGLSEDFMINLSINDKMIINENDHTLTVTGKNWMLFPNGVMEVKIILDYTVGVAENSITITGIKKMLIDGKERQPPKVKIHGQGCSYITIS